MQFITKGLPKPEGPTIFDIVGVTAPEPTVPVFAGNCAAEIKLPVQFLEIGVLVEGEYSADMRFVEITAISNVPTDARNLFIEAAALEEVVAA